MAWTFLRPGYFMSNVARWAPGIRQHGHVAAPCVDALFAPIAPSDIARVAAAALTERGHEGQAYSLTGREFVSVRQQVATIARVLGRSIDCLEEGIDASLERARRAGQPDWLVVSLERMWWGLASGSGRHRTDAFHDITGETPQSFEDWCTGHRSLFEQ